MSSEQILPKMKGDALSKMPKVRNSNSPFELNSFKRQDI
jgi:hypothetical protein